MRVVALVALLTLTACNQTGPRQPSGELFLSDAQISVKDDDQCRSYGTTPGTDVYLRCRATLKSMRLETIALLR